MLQSTLQNLIINILFYNRDIFKTPYYIGIFVSHITCIFQIPKFFKILINMRKRIWGLKEKGGENIS